MGAPKGSKNALGHGPPLGNKNAVGHDGSNAGRPRKVVDDAAIMDLAKIHCTNEEICHMLNISEDLLIRNFEAILKEGRANGKMSVRRQQVKLLMEGNATMGVWLGKVYLKQRDQDPPGSNKEELPPIDVPIGSECQRKPKNDG
jgi:hypothetical protein